MPLMARSARYRNENEVFFSTVNVLIMDLIKLFLSAAVIISNEKSIAGFVFISFQVDLILLTQIKVYPFVYN